MNRIAARVALCFWLGVLACAKSADAQEIPLADPAAKNLPVAASAEEMALRSGLTALASAGTDPEALAVARKHFLRVAWRHPEAGDVIAALLRTSGADADARVLWSHAWWGVACDSKGKARLTRELSAALAPDDAFLETISVARAEALRALLAWAQSAKPSKGVRGAAAYAHMLWAREIARALVEDAPALAETASAIDRLVQRFEAPWNEVIDALEAEMTRALSARDLATGIRAARLLRGMCAQAVFKDLKGPEPPDLSKVSQRVAGALQRLRSELAVKQGPPLTVAALEEMELQARERFSEDHRDFDSPATAVSLTDRYRIETACGHATLLGAAETVERHHERLVDWYGQDPFLGKQGLVRIVPESFGLEEEGAPFWWAGGFQSGDVTTVKFTCGKIEGLGRTLTHELTHRFDGAIWPGLPAWMVEGRAVWTAEAYGSSLDTSFAAGHASFGPIEAAFIKGYGGERKLEQLVTSTIDDYRDNYTAGYALWVYLSSWEPGAKRLFEPRLEEYMKGMRKSLADPKAWFEKCFCDDAEGRPKDFKAFADGFAEFLRGFYWQNPAPWRDRYAVKLSKVPKEAYVYEDEAWSWERDRAEPWFGQDQASFAAELLAERGAVDASAAALWWSLTVDEWSSIDVQRLAQICETKRLPDAAWMLRCLDHARSPWIPSTGVQTLPAALGALTQYTAALEAASKHYRERGWLAASYAMQKRAERVGRWWGVEESSSAVPPRPSAHDIDAPPRRLGLSGWIEDGLTGYEERRAPELWYETPDADLFVGRKAPREGTGGLDRASHQRDAFTRTKEWIAAGQYLLRTRVHFTTSFNSGAIVFGYLRRDRNLRLSFRAGDFLYSIGRKDDVAELESVRVSLEGLRVRDDHLKGSLTSKSIDFGRPTSSFEVELWVDYAQVHAWVHGHYVGTYHTVDGQPIEGYVGFAMGQGAVRIEAPTITRLDQNRGAYEKLHAPVGLELDVAGTTISLIELMNRRVRGVPLDARGTLALFMQGPFPAEEPDQRQLGVSAKRAVDRLRKQLVPYSLPQRLVLLVPEVMNAETRTKLIADLGGAELEFEIVEHKRSADLRLTPKDDGEGDAREPYLLFVDPAGVLRSMVPFSARLKELPESTRHWSFVFRGRPKLP